MSNRIDIIFVVFQGVLRKWWFFKVEVWKGGVWSTNEWNLISCGSWTVWYVMYVMYISNIFLCYDLYLHVINKYA